MILHLMNNDEKFSVPYISFINNNFDTKYHKFLVVGGIKSQIYNSNNVEQIISYRKNIIKVLKYLNRYDKIIIHSLNNTDVSKILFIQPWLLKKSYWVVWGADLYYFKNRQHNIKSNINEFIRKVVIRNIGSVCTLVKDDYNLAKQWYKVEGKYFDVSYINPIKIEYLDIISNNNKLTLDECIRIQVGNSADLTNKHFEVFDLLYKYKNENIMIFAPLSYGNKEYAKKVADYGEKLYGNKFIPMMDFLDPIDYARFLNKIDIAIFANNRQQALGNIYMLLYLDKKIYIRNDISTWKFLKDELDIEIYNYLDITKAGYIEFAKKICKNKNKDKIKQVFNENRIKKQWELIFSN